MLIIQPLLFRAILKPVIDLTLFINMKNSDILWLNV